jgi:IMP dehydrogenase
MKLYRQENQLCFDDILLVPNPSAIESRKDIDLSMSIGYGNRKINLYLPVISAPMDTVTESAMAIEIAKFGGLGIIHRYSKIEDQAAQVFEVSKKVGYFGSSKPSDPNIYIVLK